MTEPAVEVQARLNTADAKKEAESFGQSLVGALTPSVNFANLAVQALGTIRDALVSFAKNSVGAALESEIAQGKLAAALKLSGDNTGELLNRTQAFNDVLARKIGLDDDDAAALQTKLLALGVLPSELERATKATLGLADATGKDATRAAREVAKAFKEGGDEAVRLEALFSVTEAKADGMSGSLQILKTQVGELGEDFGSFATKNKEVSEAVKAAAENVEILRGKLKDSKDPINEAADGIGKIGRAIDALATLAITHTPDLERMFDALVAGSAFFGNPLAISFLSGAAILDPLIEAGDATRASELSKLRARDAELDAERAALLAGTDGVVDFEGDTRPIEGKVPKKKRDRRERPSGEDKADTRAAILSILGFDDDSLRAADEVDKARRESDAARTEYEDGIAEYRRERRDAQLKEQQHQSEVAQEIEDRRLEQEQAHWAAIGTVAAQGVASYLSKILAGKPPDFGEFFGGLMVQMGGFLIQLGTAGVLAGTLGTVVPALATITGGELGIAAGLAAIGGGALMIAAGNMLGGSGETAPTPALPAGAGASSGAASRRPPSFDAGGDPRGFRGEDNRPRQTIVNVNFGRGVIVGTPREAGREIRRLLTEESTLRNALGGAR